MTVVDWADINPGDLVLGKDGNTWQVEARTGDGVHLFHGAKAWTGRVTGPVTRVATATEVTERALAVAQVRLGGEVVAVGDAHRGHRCPTTYPDTGSLAAHLHVFHGINAWSQHEETYARLKVRHDNLHDGPPHEGMAPHWHDPDFYRKAPLA